LVQFIGAKLAVGGAVSVDTGAGTDFVDFGYDTVSVKAGVTIKTGDNADGVTFFGDGSVKGDLVIDLGPGNDGSSNVDIGGNSHIAGNLKIGGKLTLSSATTDLGPVMLGNTEELSVKDVTVGKAIAINLGDVDSTVTIDNLIAKDTFTLNTGAGKDDVEIEQNTDFGPSVFSKAVSIDLGADNDTIKIGVAGVALSANSFAKFLGPVTVAGGLGSDTKNDFTAATTNFFAPGILPTVTGFEISI
jgi:hypothetical protein